MLLSEQQIQILKFLSEGKTQKEISEILYISKFKVHKQLQNCIKKLSAKNKTETAVKAVILNII